MDLIELYESESGASQRQRAQAPGPSPLARAAGMAGQVAEVEAFGVPGLLSVPAAGAALIVVPVGGSRRESVAVAGHYYRLSVDAEAGDVVLFSVAADGGSVKAKVTLKAEGSIAIEASDSADITIETGGNVEVTAGGNVVVDAAEVHLAGDGESLVKYSQLNSALQSLVSAINAALGGKADFPGSPGGLSLNISAAEADKVKTE